jgi:septal ring factor EnvC (AmiA/AmiB activator)
MPVATFDTLKFANTLKAAGVPSQQAEAQAVAFAEVIQVNMKDLVTKDDLERGVSDIRAELQTGLADVRREIAEIQPPLRHEISSVRTEVKGEIVEFRAEIVAFKAEMRELIQQLTARIDTYRAKTDEKINHLRWMVGVAVFGIVMVLIRVFVFRNI